MANFIVCVLSGAAGAAGAIVSAPLMVTLGLSPVQAIATTKFSGFGISIGTSARFFREKLTDKRTVIIFSITGALSAITGSLTLLHFQEHTVVIQKLMGLVILAVGIPLLYVRSAGLKPRQRSKSVKALGLVLLTLAVFLQVAIGSGIGSLQMVVLISCFGMTALVASATRRAMQLTVSTISLAIYMFGGLVDYRFGVIGLVTSLAGGFIGAHIAVKKGNKFVINLFAFVSALLALQLIFG